MGQVTRVLKSSHRQARLTIITVVKDDAQGLLKTARTVASLIDRRLIQYVVWINDRSSSELAVLEEFAQYADCIVLGADIGIFDAMNAALRLATGTYVMFLNARDEIIEPFCVARLSRPSLIRVSYTDYFGRSRVVRARRTLKFGIPYCHQGMILPREGYQYDATLKYGADYLALLKSKVDWPLPLLTQGMVRYDTSGVSTVNRWEADRWTARVIRQEFGVVRAVVYLGFCVGKLLVKRMYDLRSIFA